MFKYPNSFQYAAPFICEINHSSSFSGLSLERKSNRRLSSSHYSKFPIINSNLVIPGAWPIV